MTRRAAFPCLLAAFISSDAQPSTLTRFAGVSSDVGPPASVAWFVYPNAVEPDCSGGFYVSSLTKDCVKYVLANETTGILAGTCQLGSTSASNPSDGAVALNRPFGPARLFKPTSLASNGTAGVFVYDAGWARLRYVDTASGVISTVAGNGTVCVTEWNNGAPTPLSALCMSANVAGLVWNSSVPNARCISNVTRQSTLMLADQKLRVIRALDFSAGVGWTVAGSGAAPTVAIPGNGRPWLSASMSPIHVAVQPRTGLIFFVDSVLATVRVLNATGTVEHVAGINFAASLSFINSPVTLANITRLDAPKSIAFDPTDRKSVV